MNYILSSRSCALIARMWSWTLSEINVGHLWKGKLKLLKTEKKRLLLVGNFFFISTLFYALLLCAAKLCSQRPFDISFSQIVEIVVNCKSNKNSRGAAGISCVIWGWIRNIKITPLSAWYFFQFRRPVTKILKMSPPVNTRLKLCSWK